MDMRYINTILIIIVLYIPVIVITSILWHSYSTPYLGNCYLNQHHGSSGCINVSFHTHIYSSLSILSYPSSSPMNKISSSLSKIRTTFIPQREPCRNREHECVMENKRAVSLFICLSGLSWPCQALTPCVMVHHQANPSPFKKTILWLCSICLLQIWVYYEPRPHLFFSLTHVNENPQPLSLSLSLWHTHTLLPCLIHPEIDWVFNSTFNCSHRVQLSL